MPRAPSKARLRAVRFAKDLAAVLDQMDRMNRR
jgi:hypothetical protein